MVWSLQGYTPTSLEHLHVVIKAQEAAEKFSCCTRSLPCHPPPTPSLPLAAPRPIIFKQRWSWQVCPPAWLLLCERSDWLCLCPANNGAPMALSLYQCTLCIVSYMRAVVDEIGEDIPWQNFVLQLVSASSVSLELLSETPCLFGPSLSPAQQLLIRSHSLCSRHLSLTC